MGVSRVFNQLFKCYQGEQAVSAGAGPDGLSCEPCWLPQPLHAAAGAYWCYTEPTASGESRRQLVVTFFSLFCLQWVASGAPTGSQPQKYNLWGHCGF